MLPLMIFHAAAVVARLFVYAPLTRAQPGFISIDCGLSTGAYTDSNNITWWPDTNYTFTGQNYDLATISDVTSLQSLRYFPENRSKNCYALPATPGNTYMVRANFLYGDFLGTETPLPTFNLEIEALIAGEVTITSKTISNITTYEGYLSATRNNIYVCLAPMTGVPFISSLELRSLDTATMYRIVQQGAFLFNKYHANFGGSTPVIRYPDDQYDRLWMNDVAPVNPISNLTINTTKSVVVPSQLVSDLVPELVMQTAYSWPHGEALNLTTSYLPDNNSFCYVTFYFAEIDPLAQNETRVFDLLLNKGENYFYNISVSSLAGGMYITKEIWGANVTCNRTGTIELVPHPDSQLGPILNALELFVLLPAPNVTLVAEALAIESLKEAFDLTSWLGDPCVATPYDWIECTNDTIPRVQKLMLSNYNLTGTIPAALSNLTALTQLWLDRNSLEGPIPNLSDLTKLQSLRLDNNNITGEIPTWLASLSSLEELLLSNNNLMGVVPSALLTKKNLTFQDFGNPQLCNVTSGCPPAPPPNSKNNSTHHINNVTGVVGGVAGGLVVAAVIILLLIYNFCFKHTTKKRGALSTRLSEHTTKKRGAPSTTLSEGSVFGRKQGLEIQAGGGVKIAQNYSFAQVLVMTNRFKRILGEGSFGKVYYGKLSDGQEVAVKRSSPNSQQGARELFNEVDLLSRVHHRNLVALVGYCQEGKEQILIYEYMPHGTVRESLYGTAKARNNPISWRIRLDIALNAAEGLEYLHTGCVPSIIHRDVKTSNILLSANMLAKVADFGLSKEVVDEDVSHVSTVVKGTTGYLDPEYYGRQKLTNKTDVYSFGIVLLELICGRQPLDTTLHEQREWNLSEWVRPQLEAGAINNIIDKAMGGNYKLDSIWKVAEIAMVSIAARSIDRPTMRQVVSDLREAIEMETNIQQSASHDISSTSMHSDHPRFQAPIAARPPPSTTSSTMATMARPLQGSGSPHFRYMSSSSETDNLQSNFSRSNGPDIMDMPHAR